MTGRLDHMDPSKRSALLGDVLSLMLASPTHQHYRIEHLREVVLPALQHNQFRLYHNAEGLPVGFASWALFSQEAQNRFLSKTQLLRPEDWNSGERLFFMEFIAPFGHIKQMIRDLRSQFKGQKAHAIRFDKDREEITLTEYSGYSL